MDVSALIAEIDREFARITKTNADMRDLRPGDYIHVLMCLEQVKRVIGNRIITTHGEYTHYSTDWRVARLSKVDAQYLHDNSRAMAIWMIAGVDGLRKCARPVAEIVPVQMSMFAEVA